MTRNSSAKKLQRPAMMRIVVAALAMAMAVSEVVSDGECGGETRKVCAEGFCCSNWGYCGTTAAYCAPGTCQSQCWADNPPPPPPTVTPPPPPPGPSPGPPSEGGVSDIITEELFNEMLLHRNDAACPASGFYTYSAFIEAANSFAKFGTQGDLETRKRELAAFFGQTSHETTGGWSTAPDGPYAWGYCFNKEINGDAGADYCDPTLYPCVADKKYYGRGPIQLSWNYNYAQAGEALGLDLLNDPDLVATDPVVSFRTAIWFWMTPQSPKPSCHDVMIGDWTPTAADIAANRLPGYGVTTNIINGGLECGFGPDDRQKDRIGYYERYCGIVEVSPGDNLDCNDQRPFNWLTVNARGKTAVRTSPLL